MLKKVAHLISQKYFDENESLEGQIAKYANQHSLNPHQIEDLTNRVNREVISGIQRQVPEGAVDPHFTFPTAKTANVIAIMRPGSSVLRPSLPSRPVGVVPSMLPDDAPVRVDRSRESMFSFIENPQSIPDKAIGLGVLSYMKNKLKDKVNTYNGMLIKMDSLMRNIEKNASDKLLSGTPIEVIESLPVDLSSVSDRLNSWGCKIAHINEPFELDENDPFVKMAFEFQELDSNSRDIKVDIDKDQNIYKNVENIVRSLK